METLWQDVRHGARTLVRSPGFGLVTVVLVAVGVGASTAVFSIFNAFLIRPLPYEQPDRLVLLHQCDRKGGMSLVSRPNYLDWREQARSFDAMSAYEAVVRAAPRERQLKEADTERALSFLDELAEALQAAESNGRLPGDWSVESLRSFFQAVVDWCLQTTATPIERVSSL